MRSPKIYGHRGASAHAPENTVEAFRLALELGADGVELDVRTSADGALVLHHDPVLADGRVIAETPRAELPSSIPVLEEVLEVCRGAIVNIEIKNIPGEPGFDRGCSLADAVVELLARRGGRDDVLVSSFHLATIDRVKALAPQVSTGFLSLLDPSAQASIPLASARGHDAVHPSYWFVEADLVTSAADARLELNTWTVDDPALIRSLAALGVHGIVTNQVDAAVRTVRGG